MLKRVVVTLILLVGLVLTLAVVANYSEKKEVEIVQANSYADLSRYILTLRQKLARYRDIPELLSTHPALISALRFSHNSNDITRANIHLTRINSILATRDSYLMTNTGITIAASNWQDEKSFVGRNFSYRPYFSTAMKGKLGQYFALGSTSKKRGFFYSHPVYYRDQILGVVVVKIDLNEIEQDWNEESTELLVSDEDGVIFISTREDWKFKTLYTLQPHDISRINASKRYIGQTLQPLNITQWLPNITTNEQSHVISLRENRGSKHIQEYLIQSAMVDDSDLNVSILADLAPVRQAVIVNMIYVGTVYLAIVLLVMVIMVRSRMTKQKSVFELREMQALEYSEARVRAIINNTRAGLITLDVNGRIESMNVTAQKLFGYTERELIGADFLPLLANANKGELAQLINLQQLSLDETLIESFFKCKNGQRLPVELVIGQMRPHQHQQDSHHFLVTLQDITERKEYETQLEQSQQLLESRVNKRTSELTKVNNRLLQEINQHSKTQNELIQAAKLAVIGQMSAGINHELNQPMMAIRGYADNARKLLSLNKTATVDQNLNEISLLTERMAKILHPLKEFSRKSSDLQQCVTIAKLRSGVLAILYPRMEKSNVSVQWFEAAPQLCVLGELLRLEQVMVNLIGNAMHAAQSAEQPCVTITQRERADGLIEILIRDNGAGIAEKDSGKIFEPFYTTKKEGQGLGLGLSISQRIIENFNGSLSAKNYSSNEQSQDLAGAEFSVLLKKGTLAQ